MYFNSVLHFALLSNDNNKNLKVIVCLVVKLISYLAYVEFHAEITQEEVQPKPLFHSSRSSKSSSGKHSGCEM